MATRPARNKSDQPIADQGRFLGAWLKNPLKTGAVAPSSRALGDLMASYIDPAGTGLVVELGPGTGPVTESLLARGIEPERLVLIEYSEEFVVLLRKRFPAVNVIQGDAYAMLETLGDLAKEPIDAIVSSLPLLTRPEQDRLTLIQQALGAATAHAPFIQFTYGSQPPVPADGFTVQKSRTIWRNLPPARVFVYRN
jgi:phosphatidylethanolamine/phosphatidyl-N-methylethanolamine N-methyltransferase